MPAISFRLLIVLLAAYWLVAGVAQAADPVRVTIEINGLSGAITESVLAQLSLERERDSPFFDEYRMQRLHQLAPGEIREALQPFGFYSPTIHSSLTQNASGHWTATYDVDPGEPIRVEEVHLAIIGPGAEDKVFAQWREQYPLQHGDILLQETYEDAKQELQRLAHTKGYLMARFERKEILVDVDNHSAVIRIIFDTGPRYRYGEIRITPTLLDAGLIKRYMIIQPGDYYDADKMLEMQRNLADSDYFQRADVIPAVDEAHDGVVPIDVKLTMRKRTRYSVGVGYATDTGPRATLGVERRYVNSAGHRFNADVTASETRTTATARYRIPLQKPASDVFTISSGWEEETIDTNYRQTTTFGVAQTRKLHYWQQTVGTTYQIERFTISDVTDRTALLIPSVRWQRVEAGNRISPRKGWRVAFGLKGASEQALSDMSFLQADLRAKLIVPALGGRLLSRVDLGTTVVPQFQELPLSQRFFAGGDFSVRGYAYNSLGPTDASGVVVGGKHLIVGSIEYDHFFGEHFGMATFFDAGNAFDVSQFQLYKGAGAGVRWRFPFGVLRVDGATAIGDPEHHWRLHISIGPDL